MTSLRDAFEFQLHDAWQDRNFVAWESVRPVYADYLEEQNDPLWPMARCPVRMAPCKVHSGAGLRVWMWRLYFDLPANLGKPRPRWWANQRINGKQLLGLPPYTLRCKGWEEETRTVRFTVVFRPRTPTRTVTTRTLRPSPRAAPDWIFRERREAMDTDLHPQGFAALFWPHEQTPEDKRSERQEQLLLFDGGRRS